MKPKLFRITTVPISLDKLLSGQMAFMSQFYNVTGISSDEVQLEKIGKKENINVKSIEMTRQITPFKDITAVFQLYKFFKKEKPTIVHTHTPKAGIVGMLAAKLANVPIRLHTVAGLPLLEATGEKRKLLNFVEKLTYSCATKIYPNSLGLKNIILAEKFCSPVKLKVIGNGSSNGIDTSYFSTTHFTNGDNSRLRAQLDIKDNDFVLIFVGRLVRDKGIDELVEAFRTLNFTDVILILVGGYEQELDPLKESTIYEIENNIHIKSVGFQNDVRPYFAIADVLVFPSYREGFPNVVMQAGAMDIPCIVSNINGCNEIVRHEYNGLIIPVKDAAAIKQAIQKLVEDTTLYNNLKQNSKKQIVENYEQSVIWNLLLSEYRTLENEG